MQPVQYLGLPTNVQFEFKFQIKSTETLIIDPNPLPEVYVMRTVLYKIYPVIISTLLGYVPSCLSLNIVRLYVYSTFK